MIKTFYRAFFLQTFRLLVVVIQTKLGNDAVFTAFTIRHFVISVAAVSAGVFFIKRILSYIVLYCFPLGCGISPKNVGVCAVFNICIYLEI